MTLQTTEVSEDFGSLKAYPERLYSGICGLLVSRARKQ